MKRTTSLQATFELSVRSSEGTSNMLRLSLQHSNPRRKIDRPQVRRRAKPGCADRCWLNATAHETRLLDRHRLSAQFLRRFSQSQQSIWYALVFEVPAILLPHSFQLRR